MPLIKIKIKNPGISGHSKQIQTTPKNLSDNKTENGHLTYGDRAPIIDKITLIIPLVEDVESSFIPGMAHSAIVNEPQHFANLKKTSIYEI